MTDIVESDLIERLGQKRPTTGNYTMNALGSLINPDGPDASQVIIKLTAENERLREALEYYAKDHKWPNEGPWGADSGDFGLVARKALHG